MTFQERWNDVTSRKPEIWSESDKKLAQGFYEFGKLDTAFRFEDMAYSIRKEVVPTEEENVGNKDPQEK